MFVRAERESGWVVLLRALACVVDEDRNVADGAVVLDADRIMPRRNVPAVGDKHVLRLAPNLEQVRFVVVVKIV